MHTLFRFHRITVATICLFFSTIALAGQLDDFEAEATVPSEKPGTHYHKKTEQQSYASEKYEDENTDEDDDWGITDFIVDIVVDSVSYGAELSLARVNGPSEQEFSGIDRRFTGSPDLPFLRVDLGYQSTTTDIEAFDGRIEAGYGPVGLEYRKTLFQESSPDDTLSISYLHGLYRVSGSKDFEFNVGLGSIEIEGNNRNKGTSATLPINIYPNTKLGIRFVPTWSWINGNPINDYDGSAAYIHKYFSFRVGYRRIESSNEVIRGPYAGISFSY